MLFYRGEIMAELARRAASLGDLKNIWGLIRQVAADVPIDLASEAEQQGVLTELMACCTSGLSPIVVGDDSAVVGALLVRRDDFDWGFRNGSAVHVSYAAVAPEHRDQGLLRGLVTEIQDRKVPIFVSVKSGDRLGLSDQLKELGFEQETAAKSGSGDLYRWQPSPSN
jgi:ribosomal protein S18 acetylase RimI-like enzyme